MRELTWMNFSRVKISENILNNMVMVTENVKDFKNLNGINLENWITR